MKVLICLVIVSGWLAVSFSGLQAQPLDTLLAWATQHNPGLESAELSYHASLERAPQVIQLPDPEVGLGAYPLPVETRLGAQVVRVGATQMLPWFGELEARKDLELARSQVLYTRIGTRKLNVYHSIRQAYYSLYEIEHSADILRQRIPIFESLERLALAKVESGSGSTADVLKVQMRIEELRQELDVLRARQVGPRSTINQLLDRELDAEIALPDSLGFAVLPDRAVVVDAIVKNHPSLRMYESEKEVARQAMAVNALDGKPTFGVGLDYILVTERTDAVPLHNGRDIVQIRGSVSIPLGREKYAAKNREEKLRIEALEQERQSTLNQFEAEIESAFASYDTAELNRQLYQRQINLTRSAIDILAEGYSAQGARFDELLRLEDDLIRYDLMLLKAMVQSHLAKTQIQRFIVD